MKKILSILLVLSMILGFSVAIGEEDLGVQIIPGKEIEMESLSLDDIQLEHTYKISGYADITPISFQFVDKFLQYAKEKAGDNSTFVEYDYGKTAEYAKAGRVVHTDKADYKNGHWFNSIWWKSSGAEADFAWLLLDITNMQKQSVSYLGEISVKVVYDDEYEYAGWVRQFNYDYDTSRIATGSGSYDYGPDKYGTFIRAALNPADEQSIDMVYTGHYVIGCTLPNVVVTDKAPLRIEITIGDNDLTYYIRK